VEEGLSVDVSLANVTDRQTDGRTEWLLRMMFNAWRCKKPFFEERIES